LKKDQSSAISKQNRPDDEGIIDCRIVRLENLNGCFFLAKWSKKQKKMTLSVQKGTIEGHLAYKFFHVLYLYIIVRKNDIGE
jgi:hypothetical protein